MMRWPSAIVLVPTYNEAENIREVLDSILKVFDRAGIDGRVIVIDDGSPDGTAGIVEEISKRDSRVSVINRGAKMGLGTAYRDGFKLILENHRDYEAVITMDADRSHNPETILNLLSKINEGYDVAVASRYVKGGGWGAGLLRKIISKGANIIARIATGLKTRDLTSGFRAYKIEALSKLDMENLEKGYVFQVQVLHRLSRKGARVAEVPFLFLNRGGGASKLTIGEMASFLRWCVKAFLKREA